ncbi:phasin family protein [Vreelandella sp. EE22]
MTTFNNSPLGEQFQQLFMAPMQTFAALGVDASERMFNAQLEAQKAYADIGIEQARKLMEVKDAEALRDYMEGQQRVAKQVVERVKGNADTVASIQRDFFQKSQKLTEQNVQKARQAAQQMGHQG